MRASARPTRHLICACVLIVLGVGLVTYLPEHAAASPQVQAQALHKKAMQMTREGWYLKARKLWESAHKLHQEPKYIYNLGRCAELTGHPLQALRYYERFVKRASKRKPYLRMHDKASVRILGLSKRVCTIRVTLRQARAQVFVDQRELGTAPLSRRIRALPGEHVITAKLRGYISQTITVRLRGGERKHLSIRLAKIKPTLVHTRVRFPVPRSLPWTAIGVGLAIGAGASTAFLVIASQKFKEYDRTFLTDPTPALEREAKRYRAAGWAMIAIGSLIAAAGVLGAVFNSPKHLKPQAANASSESDTIRWFPVVSPAGLGVMGQF